jgi:hypothetical protein
MIEPKFIGEIIDYLIELHEEYEDSCDVEYIDIVQMSLNRFSFAAKCLLDVRNRNTIQSIDNKLLQKLKDLINDFAQNNIYFARSEESNEFEKSITQAISAIANTWKKHPETLVWLKKLAPSGYYSNSRFEPYIGAVEATAVRELAQGWKDDPEILLLLKALVQSKNEDDGAAQLAAIQELAQGWKDDLETLPILKAFVHSSTDSWVKAMAVRELVRGWKHDPDTVSILKTLAQDSKDWQVRDIAVEELARGWKDDSNTLSFLKTCVQHDSNDFIREKVMQELIKNWQASSDIYDFLYECAVDDSFNGVLYGLSFDDVEDKENLPARQTALKAISEQYLDHPQTLPLLRDRAENDPDEKVREFAREKLAELEE